MKSTVLFNIPILLCLFVLTGCSFLKPSGVAPRLYVLSALPNTGVTTAGNPHILGIGYVPLPGYLMTRSFAVRQGDSEIVYLHDARWAERLDRGLQRVLGANLASQLPGVQVRYSAWRVEEVSVEIQVSVERLEVDADGACLLEASWRITAPGDGALRKAGRFYATRQAAPPQTNPEAAVHAFNALVAELGQMIARAVAESAS